MPASVIKRQSQTKDLRSEAALPSGGGGKKKNIKNIKNIS
jgi:hypothetical protein